MPFPMPGLKPLLHVPAALALAVSSGVAAAPPEGLQACRLRGVEHPAWCGRVARPLDPAQPAGVQIDVHFAVLPALSRQRRPDPVLFFAGGPGQSAIDLAGPVGRLLARLSNRRDLVLIDQRGTGRSAPLHCEGDDAVARPLAEALDESMQALQRCRDALQRLPHGDLRHYTTAIAVQDADAVRRALGADRVNLVGVSYGTRVALDYLRQHPQTVRRAVLDGVAPPDMVLPVSSADDAAAAFEALLTWCEGDTDCRRRHPALRSQWQALRAALPKTVTLSHPFSGREEAVRLTPALLAGLVRAPLYAPTLAAALPAAIGEAAGGRWSALAGLAMALAGGRGGTLAQGLHFSVICSEDAPRLPPASGGPSADGAADFAGLAERYRQACQAWPRGAVPDAFYRLAPAAAPVLLLSGAIDPVTPPRHGERVARALGARARHVVIPAGGHGLLALPCVRDLVFRFVDADDESAALAADGGCPAVRPRPPVFVSPGAAEAAR
jgi:pimeloyl-ACP methyl ester carboxylesterase